MCVLSLGVEIQNICICDVKLLPSCLKLFLRLLDCKQVRVGKVIYHISIISKPPQTKFILPQTNFAL